MTQNIADVIEKALQDLMDDTSLSYEEKLHTLYNIIDSLEDLADEIEEILP